MRGVGPKVTLIAYTSAGWDESHGGELWPLDEKRPLGERAWAAVTPDEGGAASSSSSANTNATGRSASTEDRRGTTSMLAPSSPMDMNDVGLEPLEEVSHDDKRDCVRAAPLGR